MFITRTETGLALQATAQDRQAASLMGIDTQRMFALGWAIGGACVGVAGGLLATFFYVFPEVGASFALLAYVAVALGGFGNVPATLAAGVVPLLIGLSIPRDHAWTSPQVTGLLAIAAVMLAAFVFVESRADHPIVPLHLFKNSTFTVSMIVGFLTAFGMFGSILFTPPVFQGVLGINIGRNKDTPNEKAVSDYLLCLTRVYEHASYVTVNISSPNTPGLRDLQAADRLRPVLVAVRAALDAAAPRRRVPLLVKIAPDLADADVDAVADLALELGLDGIIATNTTVSRDGLASPAAEVAAAGAELILFTALFDQREQMERLAAEVLPKLG